MFILGVRGSGMRNHTDSLRTSSWHFTSQGSKWWYVPGSCRVYELNRVLWSCILFTGLQCIAQLHSRIIIRPHCACTDVFHLTLTGYLIYCAAVHHNALYPVYAQSIVSYWI